MILASLRELALREGLVEDPSFESKPVRWIIELRPDGRFRQAYDTSEPQSLPENSKKKPKMEARLMAIPRRYVRASGIKTNFLVDNAKYVLGEGAEAGESDPKNIERHAAFRKLLEEAQATAPTPELQAVLAFLDSPEQRAACMADLARKGGLVDNDLFTFELESGFLHQVEELRHFWTAKNTEEPGGVSDIQCLVCGEQRAPVTLHNQIQIRGASTSGVPLVSFNAGAFEKYGWSGNANAPVCTACMTAYVEGLRRLTRPRYTNPKDGKQLHPLSTVLTGDTTAIYWADAESALVDAVPLLREDAGKVKDLLASPHKGSAISVGDPNRFFCLILTGVQGRAVVRRVQTDTVSAVEENLKCYFDAIDVDRFDRQIPIPQFRLLQSMVLNGELSKLSPELATELWMASLFALPLPRSFLAAVITRNRAERKVTAERAALLQFYFSPHLRSAYSGEHDAKQVDRRVAMSLDVTSKDPAYLLGRLLAVLENLQTAAQGQGLNRTLVDRTFGAASTRPGVVFPQLIQTAQHHFAKAGRKAEGRTTFLNRTLGEIMDGLDTNGFSATLTLEQQGRFALGYYHQRQSFFRGKSNPEAETAPQTTIDTTASEEAAA